MSERDRRFREKCDEHAGLSGFRYGRMRRYAPERAPHGEYTMAIAVISMAMPKIARPTVS